MIKLNKIIIYLFLFVGTTSLFADDFILWHTNAGLYGGANINLHQPDFSLRFQGITGKPIFNTNTSSFSGFIGAEINTPINDFIGFTGRLNYNAAGVELNGNIKSIQNTLDASLSYLDISPLAKFYNILPLNSLYLTTGLNVGIPLTQEYDFSQVRGSQQPRNAIGDIPDASLRFALVAGVGYVWNITDKIYLSPEFSIHLPFTKISSNEGWDSWKVPQLRLGVSLTYDFYSRKKKKEKKKELEQMEVNISQINYYNNAGERQNVQHITLEEIEYGELFPLVPYIFYDVNETELAAPYKENKEENLAGTNFSESKLPNEAIAINNRIIDIVGKRLENNKDATLTITGTIDGKYETEQSISEGRASTVKKYLLDNYDINENNIQTVALMLPQKPSAQTVQDGVEENRRVELSSNSPEILAPIFIKGKKQRLATPEVVEFVPEVSNADSILLWELEIMQSDRLVKKINGSTLQPIKWHIATNELLASQIPVDYTLTVFKNEDESSETSGSIPLEFISFAKKKTIEQADRSINKYSLILFDFDKSNISDADKKIIDRYIIPEIKYKSNIKIFGFTDRIGNADYNKKLAKSRADAVRDYILTKNKNVKIDTFGIDANEAPFDNNTAIGRQLSRTVQVFLVTPKE